MSVTVNCPNCGSFLKLPEGIIGKRLKCPKCRTGFEVAPPNDPSNQSAADWSPVEMTPVPPPQPPAADPQSDWTSLSQPAEQKWSKYRSPNDRFLTIMAWSCYGSVWVFLGLNCLVILLLDSKLAVAAGILSLLWVVLGLGISLFTFALSVKSWPNKNSGVPVAGVICSSITTIIFTCLLMCNCFAGAVMIEGIKVLDEFSDVRSKFPVGPDRKEQRDR